MYNEKPTLGAPGMGTQEPWSEPPQLSQSCHSVIVRRLGEWLSQAQGEGRGGTGTRAALQEKSDS